jgi:hypothetical protein
MMNDMRTIVGLFEDAGEARRAVAELKSSNIRTDYIREVTNAPESRSMLESLASDIGEPDIRFYQEGVRQGGTLVVVTAPMQDAQRAAAILARYNTVDVDARSAEYRTSGGDYSLRDFGDEDYVLPVVEEQLTVGKREVERGRMRVYSRVIETPVEEQVTPPGEPRGHRRRPGRDAGPDDRDDREGRGGRGGQARPRDRGGGGAQGSAGPHRDRA